MSLRDLLQSSACVLGSWIIIQEKGPFQLGPANSNDSSLLFWWCTACLKLVLRVPFHANSIYVYTLWKTNYFSLMHILY